MALDEGIVLPFSALDRDALSLVGGKGKNLGELSRAGFPVPAGFCLTTRAYREVAAGAALGPVLEALAAAAPSDTGELSALAARAHAALLAAPVPADLKAAILAAYATLGGPALRVAVRSSATAEDLPDASFAGQQETFLNVSGEQALLAAVQRCWASLWTERAVVYRAANRIAPAHVELSVVVQRMIDAEISGVLFTANPLTGKRRQAVIDASRGLGEAIVSGAVTPDHYVVDTPRSQILERRAGGGAALCLSDEQVKEIARLGTQVEAHFGAPQDIEWSIDKDGRVWLLQSRPITTLFPLPAGAPATDDVLRVYFSTTLDEGVSKPLTPMGSHAIRLVVAGCAHALYGLPASDLGLGGVLVEIAGRLYYDITPLLRSDMGRRVLTRGFEKTEAEALASVRSLFSDPRLSERRFSRLKVAKYVLTPLVRTHFFSHAFLALRRPEEALARGERSRAEVLALGDVAEGATPFERLCAAERLLTEGSVRFVEATGIEALVGLLSFAIAGVLLRGIATDEELDGLLRGLPNNPTTEMNLTLWALAQRIARDEEAARAVREETPESLSMAYQEKRLPGLLQESVGGFLKEYGHRSVAEIDLGVPRWSEDPAYVFGVLGNYLRLEDPAAAPDVIFRRAVAAGEAAQRELGRRARARGAHGTHGWVRGALSDLFLARAREMSALREVPKFHFVKTTALARSHLKSVGDALVVLGRLEAASDIFFVTLPEARAGLAGEDLRALVRRRREDHDRELRRKRIPSILLSDGTEPAAVRASDVWEEGTELRGLAASAGVVRGRARVILDPHGARLMPGEILVVPSTDPGWTPLFLTAAGLVMDRGGPMSHGSVIAREYGIPAVVGAGGATTRITTGQEITVDGGRGVVHLA